MLKALVFAGTYAMYRNFLREFHLHEEEYRFVNSKRDTVGYHKSLHPDLRIILLSPMHWEAESTTISLFAEFATSVYGVDEISTAIAIGRTEDAGLEELPQFLASDITEVRSVALRRLKELQLKREAIE